MLRPDESDSLASGVNAIRSDTCSPSTSTTRRLCPFRSRNAVPLCGARRCRVVSVVILRLLGFEMHWAGPVGSDLAAGVLAGLAVRTVVTQHRVVGPVQLLVALADRVAQLLEALLCTQALELQV